MLIEIEKEDFVLERMRQNLWTFKDESGSVPWHWRSWAIIANSEDDLYRGCLHWFGRDKRSCEVLRLVPIKICRQEIADMHIKLIFDCAGAEALELCGCVYIDSREWKNPEFATKMLPK